MVDQKTTTKYRQDAKRSGELLTKEEREELLRPYLPSVPASKGSVKKKRQPIRTFLKAGLYLFVYTLIHFFFSVYVRLRRYYHALFHQIAAVLHYHHRTPELIQKDVRNLTRLPQHLSVIIERSPDVRGRDGLEKLLDEAAEISVWCACAGIPTLSIYERTGVLKNYIPKMHKAVASKLHAYFGEHRPSLQVRAPHMQSFLNGDVSEEGEAPKSTDAGHLSLLLLSAEDGRSTLVDLTKTLAEMSQQNKIAPKDVTLELIDSEISESVMGEPDLVMCFGPRIQLQGYPPWQLRLAEIFYQQDHNGVDYLVWLKGLHQYGRAQMRFGR